MPLFEQSLIAYLINQNNAITNLADHVYMERAPEKDMTGEFYAVLYQISTDPIHAHDTLPSNPETLIQRRYQLSVFGPRQTIVFTIANSLRLLLDGYEGTMVSHLIGAILLLSERRDYEEDSRLFQYALDFQCAYREI